MFKVNIVYLLSFKTYIQKTRIYRIFTNKNKATQNSGFAFDIAFEINKHSTHKFFVINMRLLHDRCGLSNRHEL